MLRLWSTTADQPQQLSFSYRLADVSLISNIPLPPLDYLQQSACSDPIESPLYVPFDQHPDPATAALIFQGPGWLENAWHQISCWSQDGVLMIQIDQFGRLILAQDKQTLVVQTDRSADVRRLASIALGPGLIIALAYQGIFVLHASTALVSGQLCAFLGESGFGKSTLAKATMPNWQRVGDDVLPVALNDSELQARPHFPQLKLSATEQYPPDDSARLGLAHIFRLQPQTPQPNTNTEFSAEPLDRRSATLALVRHSVAGQLFPPQLLSRQLQFAARVAAEVPVLNLRYPKSFATLPQLRDFIRERCAATHS